MTLTELFTPITSQEFPPKYVFVYHEGEPKTIMVSEIAEFDTMYKFDVKVADHSLTQLSKEYQLPSLIVR